MKTLRIEYTKTKYMKYLGHLELMKLFERTFRFEKFPLKYSEGFNPIPKMTFAAPLSVGYASEAEIMEVQLVEELPLEKVLGLNMPDGIEIKRVKYVECKQSLMAALSHAQYEIKSSFDAVLNEENLKKFLAEEAVFYEKKTKKGGMKQVNLLEQVKTARIDINLESNEIVFNAILVSGSNGSLNPEKFLNVFRNYCGLEDTEEITIVRTGLFWEKDTELDPLYELINWEK